MASPSPTGLAALASGSARRIYGWQIALHAIRLPGPGSCGNGSATRVVALIGDGSLEVIFPPQKTELRRTVANKRYLRERIPQDQLEALIEAFRGIAVSAGVSLSSSPITSRDRDDTFLLEVAFAGDVDYLVSGDRDVLVLRPLIDRPRIVSPAQFLAETGLG